MTIPTGWFIESITISLKSLNAVLTTETSRAKIKETERQTSLRFLYSGIYARILSETPSASVSARHAWISSGVLSLSTMVMVTFGT